jgi:aryl-alcohol dehydrogenase-like predicted oxidoreductase
MADIGHTAIGAWSGGRVMHFGEPLDDARLEALIRPGADIRTVVTADVYAEGEADRIVGRAIRGLPRDEFCIASAIGHDFVDGVRRGSSGYPRFTDPGLRGEDDYRAYLFRAAEASLERLGTDHVDLVMLHNPDRTGYTNEAVWRAMSDLRAEGLARMIGIAPGPANGFTLDLIGCVEMYGDEMDWAMIILNPFEPWPGKMALPALDAKGVKVLARVVDYGGIFHGDLPDEDALMPGDHRAYRPAGWVAEGRRRLAQVAPIADRHGLTPLQLAAQWTLAQQGVHSVVPTFIQEAGENHKTVEDQRRELATTPVEIALTADDLAEIDRLGDNHGCMPLKGGTPGHSGEPMPDSWPMEDDLVDVAGRWGIDPARDLVHLT